MKAILYTEYGSPDVLRLTEVEKPLPKDNEILVQIHAASANPLDWHFMRGKPYLIRPTSGLRKPKDPRLGVDFAGRVEAVGSGVTAFRPGDEVFGSRRGAFAEYLCTQGKAMALKPANLTFEQAAAIPVAATTALQGLRDKAAVQPGQRVLINGAAGGVGTFAVQLAKVFGAEVTAVCSTRNVDLVRSLGADHVIDYTQENFTQSSQKYDLLYDIIGNQPLTACLRILNAEGKMILAGGSGGPILGPIGRMIRAALLSRFVSQKLDFYIAEDSGEDLNFMKELIEAEKVKPVIDQCYKLEDVPDAIHYLEQGHARGKVVITMDA